MTITAEAIREQFDSCVSCEKALFEGDLYYPYDDGPVLCAACTPTWGEAEATYAVDAAIGEDDEMREQRSDFAERMEAYLTAGGSRDDKLPLSPL